jgi:protein translocase SEC61 complex gamma subunit
MKIDAHKKVKDFYHNSKRVLQISSKPHPEGFKRTLKIVLLGILALGVLGYVISYIISLLA